MEHEDAIEAVYERHPSCKEEREDDNVGTRDSRVAFSGKGGDAEERAVEVECKYTGQNLLH